MVYALVNCLENIRIFFGILIILLIYVKQKLKFYLTVKLNDVNEKKMKWNLCNGIYVENKKEEIFFLIGDELIVLN